MSISERKFESNIDGLERPIIDDSMVPTYEDLTVDRRREMFNAGELERELLFRSFEKRLIERTQAIKYAIDLSNSEE